VTADEVRPSITRDASLSRSLRTPRAAAFAGVAFALLLTVALVQLSVPSIAAELKTPEPAKPAAAPPSTTIPVAEVALRAAEVSDLVVGLKVSLAPSPEIETIGNSLRDMGELVERELAETSSALEEQQTLESLQREQQRWQERQLQLTGWLQALTARASQLQDELDHIADLLKTWTATRSAARAAKAPQGSLRDIDATLVRLETAQTSIQTQRAAALQLQSGVALEVARCGSVLAQIAQVQQRTVFGLLVRGHPPIWSGELWTEVRSEFPASARKVAARYRADLLLYLGNPAYGMPLHLGLFLVLTILFYSARRRLNASEAAGKTESAARVVFEHPFAAALIIVLIVATSLLNVVRTPQAVRELFWIANMLPVILLLPSQVERRLARVPVTLALLYAMDNQRRAFAAVGSTVIDQAILVVETFVGLAVALWWLGTLRSSAGTAAGSSRLIVSRLVLVLFAISFTVGLVGGSLGYMRLARLFTSAILVAGVFGVVLYAAARILAALLVFLFQIWPLRLLRAVRGNRELLVWRAYRVLLWAATFAWLARYLNYLGLLNPALDLIGVVMAAKIERGTVSISVSDVLTFVFAVWVAYKLSAFFRFLLEEDVYPRIGIASGQSYALSSLLNYLIVTAGFVVGLGIVGADLSKLTILFSAFGVGIGFGLQSVVNNFVSGLILLFERPIRVGDAVQVGTIQGRVRRIGIRASTVGTMQGAEIIVPNGRLISEEVTNWTRSDQLRRVDVKVGISYGTAQKKVIELLESAARAQPLVLHNPPPEALFMGYGDSSIDFELRVWCEFADWVQVQSGLTAAVYDAVYAAGMSFPFPQRVVQLLRDPPTGSSSPPDESGKIAEADMRIEQDSVAPNKKSG